MSILKYKYKAHKFINYAFYIVVFIFGFLLGFTTQKLDFNKLISQLLMIDSVSAYTITQSDKSKLNEDFIYESFKNTFSSFKNPEDYVYFCTNYVSNNLVSCHAMKTIDYNQSKITLDTSSYFPYVFNIAPGTDETYTSFSIYSIEIKTSNDDYYISFNSSVGGRGWYLTFMFNDTNRLFYTNIDIDLFSSDVNKKINVLNFNGFNLEFNENLFKDNPDFKEVCVPNNKDFVISTNNFELLEDDNSQFNGTKSYNSYGFIWFPYYPKGLESYLYDNSKPDNVWIPDEDETYFDLHPIYHYWLDNKEEIDRVWNLEDPGSFLKSLGYTSKYSYFGWYTHPFVVRYANSGLRQFSVFRFNEDFEFYSTLENGIDYFEKLEEARNGNVCFYIKKDFDVNLLNTDEFGDKYGDITIMGDEKLEISTSVNISNLDSKGLFEKVKLFLNEISDSIDFVKDYIFDLYDSMPYLLKLFIISVFGLIVIKILIGMVVR